MNRLDTAPPTARNPRVGLATPLDSMTKITFQEDSKKTIDRVSRALKKRVASNVHSRSLVGSEALKQWERLVVTHPTANLDEIFTLMNEFLESKSQMTESIIERLNFIEIIDVLKQKGENV